MFLSPSTLAELPSLTRRLVDASLTISDLSPERPEFLHAVLCQLGLPRSRQNPRTFERHCGGASLLLEAGSTATGLGKWAECQLPYGAQPRLVLYHLCSEAVRTQSNVIDLEYNHRKTGRSPLNIKTSALLGCPILLFHNRSDNYRKPIGILTIGLCTKVAVPERTKVAVVFVPKWPWISV